MKPCNNNQRLRRSLLGMLLTAMILAGTLPSIADVETATRVYDPAGLTQTRVTAPDGNDYMKVEWEGLELTGKPGAPFLPVEYIRFLIPVYSKVTKVSITDCSESTATPIDIKVYPTQPAISTNEDAHNKFMAPSEDDFSYAYPVSAEYVGEEFVDGCNHIVTIAVFPINYDPKNGNISHASKVSVSIQYEDCQLSELQATPHTLQYRTGFFDLSRMIVNPARLLDKTYNISGELPVKEPTNYYIITPKKLESAFQDLATWKRQKGYKVVIKSIEDICNDPRYKIGARHEAITIKEPTEILDSAMSLRCYLYDQFMDSTHYFCLLAGDWHTSMPIRKVLENNTTDVIPNSPNYSPTDNYFSDFNTNISLKKSPSNIYTLPNYAGYIPSLYMGRLLCYEPEHIKNYVDKLIVYESNPGLGNTDYLENGLYVYHRDGIPYQNTVLNATLPLNNNFAVLDSCDRGGSTIPHRGSDIIKYMKGKGLISFHSHGTPVSLSTCRIGDNTKYVTAINSYRQYHELGPWVTDDADDQFRGLDCLDNVGSPSVLYTLACEPAPFDDIYSKDRNGIVTYFNMPYNMAQSYTMAGNYGGVAFLGNTRDGYWGESDRLEAVWNSLVTIYPRIGISEALSKYFYLPTNSGSSQINSYYGDRIKNRHHLIGDPEFEIWLGSPKKMDIILKPTLSGVDVINGIVPDSTYYAISDGNSYSTKALVSNNTHFVNPCSGEYSFSLWKTGYLPIIKLFAQRGLLSESKRYIVQDAILGSSNSESIDSEELEYKIINGGNLSVHAIDNIAVYQGFSVENGGVVEFDCDNTVNLNGGIVRNGGTLVIRAKDVKMASGFKVELGGILKIINN